MCYYPMQVSQPAHAEQGAEALTALVVQLPMLVSVSFKGLVAFDLCDRVCVCMLCGWAGHMACDDVQPTAGLVSPSTTGCRWLVGWYNGGYLQ